MDAPVQAHPNRKALYKSIISKYPDRFISVEVTNACNLKCPLCSTGANYDSKRKGLMDFDKFANFLNQVTPVIDGICFVGSGEVFLHRRFLEFVRYAANKKLWVECPSNGYQIGDPEEIVKSGLNRISIAIDGLTQSQYEMYRVGGKVDEVVNNVRRLVAAKRKLKSYYPEIFIVTVVSRHNEHSLDEIEQLARRLETDGVVRFTIMDELRRTEDWHPTSEGKRPVKRETKGRCHFTDKMGGNLTWNGEWNLCCFSPHHADSPKLVNAFESADILQDLDSDHFVQAMRASGSYPMCDGCFYVKYDSYSEYKAFNNLKSKLYKLRRTPKPITKIARRVFGWLSGKLQLSELVEQRNRPGYSGDPLVGVRPRSPTHSVGDKRPVPIRPVGRS